MSAMIIGCMTPAAKPCSTRPSTTISKLVPTTESAVPTKKMQLISTNVPRTPKARANQALRSWLATMVATKAVASHCAWSCPTPKAPITVGTATLASVDESTIPTAPAIPAPITSHLLVRGAAAVDNELSWKKQLATDEHKPDDAVLFDPRRTEVHHAGAAVSRSTRMTRSGRPSNAKVLGVIGNLLYPFGQPSSDTESPT